MSRRNENAVRARGETGVRERDGLTARSLMTSMARQMAVWTPGKPPSVVRGCHERLWRPEGDSDRAGACDRSDGKAGPPREPCMVSGHSRLKRRPHSFSPSRVCPSAAVPSLTAWDLPGAFCLILCGNLFLPHSHCSPVLTGTRLTNLPNGTRGPHVMTGGPAHPLPRSSSAPRRGVAGFPTSEDRYGDSVRGVNTSSVAYDADPRTYAGGGE